MRERAAAGYGALVATGEEWLLSFSPELFFALEGGTLTAKPMKGTAVRDPIRRATRPMPRSCAPIPSSAPRI